MDRFIGIDVHKATCTLGVMGPSGKRGRDIIVETNGAKLVEQITRIPGKKHLCFEEGPASQWLVELLTPHVQGILITTRSRKRESSNDRSDALELANAIRVGAVAERVMKPTPELLRLRSLCDVYRKITNDSTRTKNRIHTLFRSRGVLAPSREQTLFTVKRRDEWISKLPERVQDAGLLLFGELDALTYLRRQALKTLGEEAAKHRAISLLRTAPGIGALRAALIVATVITPHRFRTKRKFWSYAGLSVVTRSSSDFMKNRKGQMVRYRAPLVFGLTRRGNRSLKALFTGAALSAATTSPEVRAHRDRLVSRGLHPDIARLTIARKLASIVLVMWKKKEAFDPTKYDRFQT